jgi:HEAT repeat protein
MSKRSSLIAACGAVAIQLPIFAFVAALGGCELEGSGPEPIIATSERWSTKQQSVVMGSVGGARLNLPEQMDLVPDTELRAVAADLLMQAGESEYALLRANAIEGLRHEPELVEPIAIASLTDENRGVRFVAAMTIGMLQLRNSSHLLEPMLLDPSDSVRAASMYSLRRCDRNVDLNPLAAMLRSDDPEVKANAAMVLGELGDRSAAPMVRNAVGRSMSSVGPVRRRIVEMQLAEAMVRLGRTEEMEVIRAALFTTAEQGEIAALACLMCGRLKDYEALPTLLNLAQRTENGGHAPEVRMAAAMAVAMIDPSQAPLDVPMQFTASDRPELRAQAAITLGKIPHPAVVGQLRQLLSDRDAMVQVSAAAAILELYSADAKRTD